MDSGFGTILLKRLQKLDRNIADGKHLKVTTLVKEPKVCANLRSSAQQIRKPRGSIVKVIFPQRECLDEK